MYYALFDSTGNLIESFTDEQEAREALDELAHDNPDSADELALLAYDDDGRPVGRAITASANPV